MTQGLIRWTVYLWHASGITRSLVVLLNSGFWFNIMYIVVALQRDQFSPKSLQQTPFTLPVGARYGVSFANSKSNLWSVIIIAMMCIISWNNGPRYNGIRLYYLASKGNCGIRRLFDRLISRVRFSTLVRWCLCNEWVPAGLAYPSLYLA